MPVSKKKGWQRFIGLCYETQSSKELDALFQFFLTSEERNAISTRVELISALLEGKQTQRNIAAKLEISIAKITRGSNALKIIPTSLRRFLLKHLI